MRVVRATFSALGVRNYRLYVAGHTVSDMGTWMQKVAQAWLVLELSGSGTLLGVTLAIQHLPILVIGPWGGLLADRLDKRRLLQIAYAVAGLLALALGVLTATDVVELWMVLALALGLGVVDALEKPARHTFAIEMVGPGNVANAITLNSIVMNSGKIVGPALAGILIAAFGLASSFLITAATYLVVVLAITLMRQSELHPVEPAVRARGQLREGLRYVRRTPELLGPLLLMTVSGTLAYEWPVTIPLLARDAFDGDAQVVGWMFAGMGAGAVLGGLLVAGRPNTSSRRLIRLSLLFGLLVVALASTPTLTLAMVAFVLVGGSSIVFRTVAMAYIQLESVPQLRGRVTSLLVVATAGTTPIGAPLVGWLAELFGARVAVGVGGVGTVLAGLCTLLYLRRRTPDTPGQPEREVIPSPPAQPPHGPSPSADLVPVRRRNSPRRRVNMRRR